MKTPVTAPPVSRAAAVLETGWICLGVRLLLAATIWAMALPRTWAAEMQRLHGHVPEATAALKPVGRLEGAKELQLAIGLPPRHQADLNKLLEDLYDPKSPHYRQFLTPAQFTERFGPTEADYQSVTAFAEAHGLKVTAIHPNRLILDVEGAVTDIEKAFHVALLTYEHPTEARQFFAPSAEPSLDLATPILQISGLDNYALPRSMLKRKSPAAGDQARKASPDGQPVPEAQGTGSGPGGTYAGNDFRAAYAPGLTLTGTGQNVGLLEFDTYFPVDIITYRTQFGLPNIPIVNVPIDGGNAAPGSGVTEVALDIEMVMSMAPGVAGIYMYEAPMTAPWVDVLNRIANDNLCSQISSSWGSSSGPNASAEAIFQEMAAQGQSFFNASGDSDAYTNSVSFPSDSPHITIVGGTTLTTSGPGGAYVSETVWNWGLDNGQYVGSSGGVSSYYSIPSWQQPVSMATNQGSTTMRNLPDVALTADNVFVTTGDGSSESVGGTSCAAPLWAAFTALVNQQAANSGLPRVGFLNPTLYQVGLGSQYASNYHDITTGNNFNGASPTKYAAVAGYDLCTGWGSPMGAGMLYTLGGPFPPTIASVSPGNGLPGETVIITGTNLYAASNVAFNGVSASFTVNSLTQITATVPVGAASGPITVTTPGGSAASPINFPIFGFSPTYGLPGTSVTLMGAGFTNASAVSFNGVSAPYTVNSDAEITATVPGAATTGPVSVTTPGGVMASVAAFTVLTGNGEPSIASFAPSSAAVGASVTITGANFAGIASVTFNGVPASFVVNSQTQITAVVPVPFGSVTGLISVNTSQAGAASAAAFTTLATLASFSPGSGAIITANGFTATGTPVYFTLNYAPQTGETLTVINNTGLGFINGTFSNLAQGQTVSLSYEGSVYNYVANYYGGTGNDLILQWADTLPLAWGYNVDGQLGDNSTTLSRAPTAVSAAGVLSGKTIVAEAAGGNHSLALCADGTIAAWGSNSAGQLGNNSQNSSLLPVEVSTAGTALAGKTVIAIAAGASHSLALCSDGTVAAWGYNFYGQLGNNSTTQSLVPIAVSTTGTALTGKTVVAVAAGQYHSLALCSDGTMAAWGENNDGQLGNSSAVNSSVPVAVTTAGTALASEVVTAIAGGGSHSLALCSNGTVAAWGLGGNGQLGNNSSSNSSTPVAVTTAGTALSGKTVAAIAAGANHSLALCSDGTMAAWGYNGYGQLGNNSTVNQLTPAAVSAGQLSGAPVTSIAAGENHSMAFCASIGQATAWGENNDGQLGINSSANNVTAPTLVAASTLSQGEALSLISSGQSALHSLAIAATAPAPRIAVQQPAGTALISGAGAVSFGEAAAGGSTVLTFVVTNNGTAPLDLASLTIDGPNSADFSVTAQPEAVVAAGGSTTLAVTFAPAAGASIGRTAALHIGSNDFVDGTFNVNLAGSAAGAITATYNSATDVPVTVANGFTATGSSISFALNFAPTTGTNLMVVKNAGLEFINGVFSNLAQGQPVTLSYGGINYNFVANYYGGAGNDLVLQWANNRVEAWGLDLYGELGNSLQTNFLLPVAVATSGVLAGKTVVQVAGGFYHTLALCSDGTVAAWGYNVNGELGNNSTTNSSAPVLVATAGTPLAGKTVIAVAAGEYHSLALCSDGTVAAWGSNSSGSLGNGSTTNSLVPVAVSTTGAALAGKQVMAVSAGQAHSVALCSDGTVASWGANADGQLGDGSTTQSDVPVAVTTTGTALAGKTVIAVAAGLVHSLALCSDGTVAAWGWNGNGQLGNNSTTQGSAPVAVVTTGALSGKTVTAISAGYAHSVALCSDGTVVAWGNGFEGQLGDDSIYDSHVPVGVTVAGTALAGKTVSTISAGAYHNMALCSDGTIMTWGSNGNGQLGIDSTSGYAFPVPSLTADTPLAGKTISSLVAGGYHTLALCSDGTLAAWGDDLYGQVGNDLPFNFPAPTPVTSSGLLAGKTVTMTAAGQDHSLLLCSDGTLAAFGSNAFGQLGDNTSFNSYAPVAVEQSAMLYGKTVVAVAAGQSHSLALCSDGTVAAWGYNLYGQVGNGATTNILAPLPVVTAGTPLAGKSVAAVGAGAFHSVALCSDGTLAAWGYNVDGELGDGLTVNSSLPVAVETVGTPLAGKLVTSLAVGAHHTVALCSDGTVCAWGENSFGQLGNGSQSSSALPVAVTNTGALSGKTVVAVAAGQFHTLALCADGTLAAWGYNVDGQLGNNGTAQSTSPVLVNTSGVFSGKTVTAISAGNNHSLAICSDGTVAGWGYDGDGELGNNGYTNSLVPVAVSSASLAAGERFTQVASGQTASHSLALIAEPATPKIDVEQPSGTVLVSGASTVDFGGSPVGIAATAAFTIRNLGNAPMTISGTSISGANSSDFAVTSAPVSSLAPGASTTMTVAFTPAAPFNRTATLSVASNDPNTASFSVSLLGTGVGTGTLAAVYNSVGMIPLVVDNGFTATGSTVSFTLNYAPSAGASLTVVKNKGAGSIIGTLSNLAQGQTVVLTYGGVSYYFVANYFGGPGNDLTLQWADTRPVGWGLDSFSQLGNNNPTSILAPVGVSASGALAGKTVTAVSAGEYHCLAVCSDGTLVAWGYNNQGQLGNNTTTNSFVPVAVTTAGTPLAGKTVIAVAAGEYHSMAVCSDGTIAAWGENNQGQLGNNSTTNSLIPVAVTTAGTALAGKTVAAVSAGAFHSLALCSDGTVAAWGANGSGELGNNSTSQSSVPVAVSATGALSGKTVVAIAAGATHSTAVCSDGNVATWGFNSSGQLGNNSAVSSSVPVLANSGALSGKSAIAISAGFAHTVALCSDGTLAAWGSNANGQLGINSTNNSTLPVAVVNTGALSGKTVTAIAAGWYHSVAACADGTVAAWGDNLYGELGDNSTAQSLVPVVVAAAGTPLAGNRTIAVSAGEYFSVALCSNGSAAAWGYDFYGALGNGLALDFPAPTPVNTSGILAGKTIAMMAAGGNHSLAVCLDGTLAAWGLNTDGQLGNGSLNNSLTPGPVANTGALAGKTPVAVAAGANHSLALCSDGTVAAWGLNSSGQLGNNSTVNSNIPVAVATAGTALAGKTVIAIAAGAMDSIALCSDGTIAAWGDNSQGELGNNGTANSLVPVAVSFTGGLSGKTAAAIAAGGLFNLALCSDGTVCAWGNNGSGQLGNGTTTNSSTPVAVTTAGTALAGETVVAVAAGQSTCLALCADGTLAAWGAGGSGELGNGELGNLSEPSAVILSGSLAAKAIIAVAAGNAYCLALCSDGTVYAWGYDSDGELGDNSFLTSSLPAQVSNSSLAPGESFIQIASGSNASHSLGLIAEPPTPLVTTLAATMIGSGTAALNGTVSAGNNTAAVSFDYGATASYGTNLPSSPTPVNGAIATAVSANLTGLSPLTTYHFRVNGSNAAGTVHGGDLAFTTVNNDAALSGLSVSGAALSPAFGRGITSYTAAVSDTTASITVAATADDGNATLQVNGMPLISGVASAPISLSTGVNNINVAVTAQDATTMQTYSVAVTRLTNQQAWRLANFGTTDNSGAASDTAEYNQNGVPNLIAYGFGLSPMTAQPGQLPQPMVNGNSLTIAFTQPAGVSGITYGAQWATSLNPANWTSIADTGSGASHVFSVSTGNSPTLFVRIMVTGP